MFFQLQYFTMLQKIYMIRVEPQHDKGLRDWQNKFA